MPIPKPRIRVRAGSTSVKAQVSGAEYEAASGIGRAANWSAPTTGPNASLVNNLATLRARSRQAVRSDGWAADIVSKFSRDVVGTGIKPLLQLPEHPEFKRQIQRLWARWCRQCDAFGRLDLYGMQSLVAGATAAAGESFIRFRPRRAEDGLAVPLQLEVIEAEQVPLAYPIVPTVPGNRLMAGIERDAIGRRVYIHFLRRHPGETGMGVWDSDAGSTIETVPVPADSVCHVALNPNFRAGLERGEPLLTRALVKLRELDAYDDAELVRKKISANIVGWITRSPMAEDGASILGEEEVDDAGVGSLTLQPGTWQVLEPGEKPELTQPSEVGGTYDPFLTWQFRWICASVGMPYEVLVGPTAGLSDRTLRQILIEYRRGLEAYQHTLMVQQMCVPIWERWIDTAILAGAITLPAGVEVEDLYDVRWTPPSWGYLQPVQEVQANELAVRNGFKSRSEVVSEAGYDSEDVDSEHQRDNDRAARMGLRYASSTAAPPASGPPTRAQARR
ncbi:MAG: phage portal protein [Niveispirillum sp.]|uniref:phage portal protein n=1 Tax=Niveispirillum sp. TaxID=1917217 RepID=UPI004035C4D0